jgi:hypothetical protein
MERSIENIWKEGFLRSDALVAPKINNLYNQKSIHILEKFKRMFKINLIAIVAFSFIFLIVSFFVGIPITGVMIFVTFSVLVFINKKLLKGLDKINKGLSSYQYLKTFNEWMKEQIAINKKMSTFLYPIIFMAMVLGFWFKDAKGMPLGERLVNKILYSFPDIYLIYGVTLIGIIIMVLILGLLVFFGGRIYMWDFNIVYGRVYRKLGELITDIESLRS